jgi:hypothetical protein
LEAVRGLKGTKEASLSLQVGPDSRKTVRVAVCSGVVNARKLVEDVRAGRAQYDFVEVGGSPDCQILNKQLSLRQFHCSTFGIH